MGFGLVDYFIVIAYLVLSVWIGLKLAGKQKTESDYFTGGRSMHWFPVAASIIATGFSGISFMGVPAMAFEKGLEFSVNIMLRPLILLPVGFFIIPILYRLSTYTVYEYLEQRYNNILRSVGSLLFVFAKGFGWFASVIYIPALALNVISKGKLPITLSILIIGLCTTGYVLKGGIKSVIWADTIQFFVILISIGALTWVIVSGFDGSISEIWRIATEQGKTKLVSWNWSLKQEFTIYGLFLGAIVGGVQTYVTDQMIVQRYFATKSVKSAVRSLYSSFVMGLPLTVGLWLVGVGLVAYYATHADLMASYQAMLDDGNSSNILLAHFVCNVMPMGLSGLIIAGILAAAMSSASSAMNSLATTTVVDFYQRFFHKPSKGDAHYILAGRVMTFVWGILGMVGALVIHLSKTNIMQVLGIVYGLFGGPLIGMFLLGFFSKRATSEGVLLSALAAAPVAWSLKAYTSWIWYGPVSMGVALIFGYLLSVLNTAIFGDKANWLDRLVKKKKLDQKIALSREDV